MTHTRPARQDQAFDTLLDAARRIAQSVATNHADDVDTKARFPQETMQALREAGLLSAPVPRSLGGAGCGLLELGQLCATLAHGCGSSAMVLAMHYIQLACVVRHSGNRPALDAFLRQLVEHQWLLASITSEVGTFGDTRSSICALDRQGDRFVLNKDATTGSYCAHADAIAVTCRRDAAAASGDQLLVLVRREDARLTQTTTWDTLGMRGTCSPGFRLESSGPVEHVLPEPYADISAQTMVPYAHTLWSSLWWGIAADAVRRAGQFVRAQARKTPGTIPPTATRLAEVTAQLQTMKQHWLSVAEAFDALAHTPAGREQLSGIPWGLRLNNLKVSCSEAAPQIVHRALQIVGILGYKNDSEFSVGRHYRDLLSASLMVSNERIAAKNASMLLVLKDMP
jgi:acyl-CoA dehydrogenase